MNYFAIITFVLLTIIDDISTVKELLKAMEWGNLKKAALLIFSGLGENEILEEYKENGENPLCLSLHKKYEKLSSVTIQRGAMANAVARVGHATILNRNPPLHMAVWNNLKSSVSALIAEGASANAKDWIGWTPLMLLVQDSSGRYNADIARILLHAGADINEPYSYSDTTRPIRPLHVAARNWNAPVAELLLSKGANVNEIGGIRYRKAPIDYVMIYKYELRGSSGKAKDTAIILLNNGARRTESNDYQKILKAFWTPAHFKLEPGTYEDFDDFLLKITAKVADVSKLASVKRNVETFSLMRCVRKGFLEIGMFLDSKFSITRKILDSVREFDKQGMFALYRLLKTCYDASRHGKRSSVIEDVKLDIFDYVLNEISKRSYFEQIPLDLMADILYEAGYYGWKIERLAWNVALAAHPYRFNMNANHIGREISYSLLLESEKDL